MCNAAESSAMVHRLGVIVVQAQLGLTSVERHSDAKGRCERPRSACQAGLNCTRARSSIGRPREYGKAAIAVAVPADHLATMLCHGVFDERIVARHGFTHPSRILQPRPGAALDVGG